MSSAYLDRFARVTNYIYDHLDEELDLARLGEIARLSPYHWHRIYQSMLGESAVATVRRLRLQRAAADLARSDRDIEAVAKRAGYGTVSSFSRAFHDAFGLPPAQFRQRSQEITLPAPQANFANAVYPVTIQDFASVPLAAIDHVGSYLEIGRAFDILFGWLGTRGLIGPDTRMVALYHDDPSAVPEAELRSSAAVVVEPGLAAEPPVRSLASRAGRYAVLRYKGPYVAMRPAYEWLFGRWLPQSGYEPDDAPCFEQYLNSPRENPPAELLTDICLPLKA
jgi:AraC family transcriptional regulator